MYRSIHCANLTVLSALLLTASALAAPAAPGAAKTPDSVQTGSVACPAILRHSFNRLQDEAPQNLCQYAGKVVLVVTPPVTAALPVNMKDWKRCTRATRPKDW